MGDFGILKVIVVEILKVIVVEILKVIVVEILKVIVLDILKARLSPPPLPLHLGRRS